MLAVHHHDGHPGQQAADRSRSASVPAGGPAVGDAPRAGPAGADRAGVRRPAPARPCTTPPPAGYARRWRSCVQPARRRPPPRRSAAAPARPGAAEGDQAYLVAALVGIQQQGQHRALDRAHPLPGRHRPGASTANSTRLPSRPSRTAKRRSAGWTTSPRARVPLGRAAGAAQRRGADGGRQVQRERAALRQTGPDGAAERAAAQPNAALGRPHLRRARSAAGRGTGRPATPGVRLGLRTPARGTGRIAPRAVLAAPYWPVGRRLARRASAGARRVLGRGPDRREPGPPCGRRRASLPARGPDRRVAGVTGSGVEGVAGRGLAQGLVQGLLVQAGGVEGVAAAAVRQGSRAATRMSSSVTAVAAVPRGQAR